MSRDDLARSFGYDGFGRARDLLGRVFGSPSPVWAREMRQAARLTRTPFILGAVTAVVSLLICSVGGLASSATEPAKVGVVLYQTFFSIAFAVVTWIGPAVAALTITTERNAGTWEAMTLTALTPRRIAVGKFAAAYSYLSLYVVMLAPVGAIPFLFGGVTPLEVVLAFVWLFLIAVLAVGLGLSISSGLESSAFAMLVTMPLGVFLSFVAYLMLGLGGSFLAHEVWPSVYGETPVWLPGAYIRAPFGLEYILYLLVAPLLLLALGSWFFLEMTVANLTSPADDRARGLKRWFLVATPILASLLTLPCVLVPRDAWIACAFGVVGLAIVLLWCLVLFAGEPLGPPRRVVARWERTNAGRLRRFLGPHIANTVSLVIVTGTALMTLMTAVGVVLELRHGGSSDDIVSLVLVSGYAAAYLTFLGGGIAWARARAESGTTPRALLVAALFLSMVGPWIAMAIGGVLTGARSDAIVLAAPSPTYVFVVLDALGSSDPNTGRKLIAAVVCALFWAVSGLVLLAVATATANRRTEFDRKRAARLTRGDPAESLPP